LKALVIHDPEEDENGYSKWQAWDIFGKVGHMMHMGAKEPFHMTIRICV